MSRMHEVIVARAAADLVFMNFCWDIVQALPVPCSSGASLRFTYSLSYWLYRSTFPEGYRARAGQ
eukprot:6401559-Amphidinium_carterae.1